VKPYFTEKAKQPRLTDAQKGFLMDELEKSKTGINLLRKDFYEAVDQSWHAIMEQDAVPDNQLTQVGNTSRKLAHAARENVDRLYPLCGLMAAKIDTEINRVWRDLHTASQHSLLTFA
jgi:hypothetical protein